MLHSHLPASISFVQAVISKSWGQSFLNGLIFAAGTEESGVGEGQTGVTESRQSVSIILLCGKCAPVLLTHPWDGLTVQTNTTSKYGACPISSWFSLSIFMHRTKNSWIPKCARIWHRHPEIPALVWSSSLVDASLQINKYPSLTKDANVCPILWKQPRGTGDSWGDG